MQSIMELIFSYDTLFVGVFFDFFLYLFPFILVYLLVLFFARW